jgi:hypothetical protein
MASADGPQADQDMPELLVILSPGQSEEALEQLREACRITRVASGRLLLVEPSPGSEERLLGIPGVAAVPPDALEPEAMKSLDQSEAWLVSAWLSRLKSLSTGPRLAQPWVFAEEG